MEHLRQSRIFVLNTSLEVKQEQVWSDIEVADRSPLWKFNAHYHEFLLDCMSNVRSKHDTDIIRQIIIQWQEAYPSPTFINSKLAWHPFCISRRIPIWIEIMQSNKLDEQVLDIMHHSLHKQAIWLALNLELDLGGNHLWENLKALIVASEFKLLKFGANLWKKAFIRVIRTQIMSTGEHYERSPMYQAILCETLRLLISLCEKNEPNKKELQNTYEKMISFLSSISTTKGRYPLFGDSTLDAPEIDIGPIVQTRDYSRFEASSILMIADHGQIAAPDLPAHAHADLGTFEIFEENERYLIDLGVTDYTGPLRDFQRGAGAHNGFILCDEVIADVYLEFRMGKFSSFNSIQRIQKESLQITTAKRIAKCSHGLWDVVHFWGSDSEGISVFWGFQSTPKGATKKSRLTCKAKAILNTKGKIKATNLPFVEISSVNDKTNSLIIPDCASLDVNQVKYSERFLKTSVCSQIRMSLDLCENVPLHLFSLFNGISSQQKLKRYSKIQTNLCDLMS